MGVFMASWHLSQKRHAADEIWDFITCFPLYLYESFISLKYIKDRQTDSASQICPALFLYMKFRWNKIIPINLPIVCGWQSWVLVTETMWPTKPEIFTTQPFTQKTC